MIWQLRRRWRGDRRQFGQMGERLFCRMI